MTLLLTAMFLTFSACSSDDDENSNPLNGTKWVANFGNDEILVIEFISDTKFQEYMADLNGNVMSTGVYSGAYTYSDDVIQFSNQTSTSPLNRLHLMVMSLKWLINLDLKELSWKSNKERRNFMQSLPLIICLCVWGAVTIFQGLTKK